MFLVVSKLFIHIIMHSSKFFFVVTIIEPGFLIILERWHCELCSICSSCGCRSPEGHPNPNLTAQQKQLLIATSRWTHEYRINHVTNLREHYAMLCSNCVSVSSNINRLNP